MYVRKATLGRYLSAPRRRRAGLRGLGACDDGSMYCFITNNSVADLLANAATGKITTDQQSTIISQCRASVATAGGDDTDQNRCNTDITAAVRQAGGTAGLPFSTLPSIDLSNLPMYLLLGGLGLGALLLATR